MKEKYNKKFGFSKTRQLFYFMLYELKSRISGRFRTPLICSFKITGRCNLKCSHCPFWREAPCSDMDFNKVCSILKNLHKTGVRIVIFEGGEPLLWKDDKHKKNISDVVAYAKKLFFYTGVTTNGTVSLDILDGQADIVFVSIDGTGKIHDAIRGKSFDSAIRNIESHKDTCKIIVNTCISRINSHNMEELIKFLNDKVYGITVQFFYPYKNVSDTMLSHEERDVVLKKLLQLKHAGYRLLDSEACLKKMSYNRWRCADFLVCSVEKTGNISLGCYLKNKVDSVVCDYCGFAVHCEISLAYRLNLSAIAAASRIFWGR